MTLDEARKQGITKVCLTKWACPLDYLDISHALVARLYSPLQEAVLKIPYGSQSVLTIGDTCDEYVPYVEPANADELWAMYKAKA